MATAAFVARPAATDPIVDAVGQKVVGSVAELTRVETEAGPEIGPGRHRLALRWQVKEAYAEGFELISTRTPVRIGRVSPRPSSPLVAPKPPFRALRGADSVVSAQQE
ncbi:MAG: hypothetical protein ABI438_08860, partial [Dermatophilaceae bacterium]